MLLEHIRDEEEGKLIANRILQALELPFDLGDRHILATVSIGIVHSHVKYRNPEEILKDADSAMYKAKALSRGQQTLYSSFSELG